MKTLSPSQAHGPAVLALIAAIGGACATPAQASAVTPAIACNAADASQNRPTRSWGVHNYSPTDIQVTCPINRPTGTSRVYGLMSYANSAGFGERANCLLISMRKSDGFTVAIKFFSAGRNYAGMPGTWVFLEPWERHYDTVQEVRCTLPANDRVWLTAFEAFAE